MELLSRVKSFIIESRRVLTITRKPTNQELKTIIKVAGVGVLLIGLIGFVISMIKQAVLK
jgi:protein transport protein SEC61 subunit gamma and related proteins